MKIYRSLFLLAAFVVVSFPVFAGEEALSSKTPEMPEWTTTAAQAIHNEIQRKIMIEELIRLNWIARELQRPEPVNLNGIYGPFNFNQSGAGSSASVGSIPTPPASMTVSDTIGDSAQAVNDGNL